jgi:hypothetical protein
MMSDERNHTTSADASPRPGGGTYPVRAAVSARHPEPAPAKRAPATRPLVPHAPGRGSPRTLLTLILLGFALVTLLLLIFSVSGYLPDSNQGTEPEPAEAPAAGAAGPDS